jgi:hypothetical protein
MTFSSGEGFGPHGPHGHVTPRADGVKARCGGPMMCAVCAKELAAKLNAERVKELRYVSCPNCKVDKVAPDVPSVMTCYNCGCTWAEPAERLDEPVPVVETCAACRYFVATAQECRRYPPVRPIDTESRGTLFVTVGRSFEVVARWPIIQTPSDMACGEFRAR